MKLESNGIPLVGPTQIIDEKLGLFFLF